MYQAAACGDVDEVERIYHAEWHSVYCSNEKGQDALTAAIQNGHACVFERLYALGFREFDFKVLLEDALDFKKYDIFALLKQYGGDPQHQLRFVFFETSKNNAKAISLLHEVGYDIDLPNGYGIPPLHGAAYYNSQEALRELCRLGSRVARVHDPNGFTPMHISLFQGSLSMFNILRHHDIGATRVNTKSGMSLLSIALEKHNQQFVVELHTCGVEHELSDSVVSLTKSRANACLLLSARLHFARSLWETLFFLTVE